MKIKTVQLYRYTLPFRKEIQFKSEKFKYRSGFLLKIITDTDMTAVSEIAPLPNFSIESMRDCKQQIFEFKNEFYDKAVPPDILRYTMNLYPSVRFGIESALLLVTAASKNLTLPELLHPNAERILPVNALLIGDSGTIEKETEKKLKEGFTSFKLKVGRLPFDEEISLIKRIRGRIGDNHSLRLDANRAFSYENGVRFLKSVQPYNPEYIEEPFQNLADIEKQIQLNETPVPIALDESLLEISPETVSNFQKAKALVLKPTLLGYTKTMMFAREAIKHQMKPVISSSFESSVGMYILASMATIIDSSVPAGLDTLTSFQSDLVNEPLKIVEGTIDLDTHSDLLQKIDFSRVREEPLG